MDLRETSFWVRQLFPGSVRMARRRAQRPKSRRGRAGAGVSVRVAEFSLYDDPASAPDAAMPVESDSGGAVSTADAAAAAAAAAAGAGSASARSGEPAPRPEIAACTVDFGRVDHGLRTPEGVDVRVELFLVAYPDSVRDGAGSAGVSGTSIGAAVSGAAAVIADDVGSIVPTPGAMFSDALRIGLGEDFEDSGATTPHLLGVVPYVWPDGVPHVNEEAGKVTVHAVAAGPDSAAPSGDAADAALDAAPEDFADSDSGVARMTTVTQLIPITDGEYGYANEHGIPALMALFSEKGPDLRDLARDCVAGPGA